MKLQRKGKWVKGGAKKFSERPNNDSKMIVWSFSQIFGISHHYLFHRITFKHVNYIVFFLFLFKSFEILMKYRAILCGTNERILFYFWSFFIYRV